MRHPPYHLRTNKAVDRAALVEAIGILANGESLGNYTYYGMGGPFLEDHRLLYSAYPQLRLVSIEEDEQTYQRQHFHRPCSDEILDLRHQDFRSFLRTYETTDQKSIVWADYTGLQYEHIDNFVALLQTLPNGSMVKTTLQCQARSYLKDAVQRHFRTQFGAVLSASVTIPAQEHQFAGMLQGMMQVAAQQALHGIGNREFQPVSSIYYKDGVGMYTLTGVLCSTEERPALRARFADWQFASLDWEIPLHVDVPELTTKERHYLQNLLPCPNGAGAALQQHLGYWIDNAEARSVAKLDQWALYHRYAATFVRASP